MNIRPFAAIPVVASLVAALSLAADEPKTGSGSQPSSTPTAASTTSNNPKGTSPMENANYLTIPFKTINGNDSTLAAFKGKVVLIVNTASECGYTPQYEGLEKLYEKYKDKGLVIVGFPANNFGGQEPGTNEQIAKFCSTKYSVTFPMMAKVSAKGADKHPLFTYLTEKSPIPGEIKWNFSKFLLDRNGALVARYLSNVTPEDTVLTSKIESVF
jgi:glutathione peroxidase